MAGNSSKTHTTTDIYLAAQAFSEAENPADQLDTARRLANASQDFEIEDWQYDAGVEIALSMQEAMGIAYSYDAISEFLLSDDQNGSPQEISYHINKLQESGIPMTALVESFGGSDMDQDYAADFQKLLHDMFDLTVEDAGISDTINGRPLEVVMVRDPDTASSYFQHLLTNVDEDQRPALEEAIADLSEILEANSSLNEALRASNTPSAEAEMTVEQLAQIIEPPRQP